MYLVSKVLGFLSASPLRREAAHIVFGACYQQAYQ